MKFEHNLNDDDLAAILSAMYNLRKAIERFSSGEVTIMWNLKEDV